MSTDRAPAHSPASMQLHAQSTDSESLISAEQVNVVRGRSLHPGKQLIAVCMQATIADLSLARQEVEGDLSAQQPELDHAARAAVEGSQSEHNLSRSLNTLRNVLIFSSLWASHQCPWH